MSQNPNPLPSTSQEPDVRRKGRLLCDSLMSTLGEVLDLSASGMRVVRKGGKPPIAVDQVMACELKCETQTLKVETRVVWIRKTGFRKYELGLTFENLTEPIARQIAFLARGAAKRESMRNSA